MNFKIILLEALLEEGLINKIEFEKAADIFLKKDKENEKRKNNTGKCFCGII